ncbi:CysZ protein [Mariprofundus ferrinatatus]|uniref:CysZ protein n=1 Tax=Mariprofundus ferrinatatus TaxID=1921087 RepID=A0A2K8L4P6_9PROT|nr:EI24 domain-containing protein [Mariprofundus ferrinatatus]ATX82082.1 CysZ protein [Mariprofundus ferrinatatus]
MIKGVLAFMAGLKLLFARSELRSILMRMAGLLLLFMVLLSGAAFCMVDYVATLWIPEGEAWYWQVVSWFAWLLALLLALFTAAISFVMFGSAAVAPWLDELAARTEAVAGKPLQPASAAWPAMVLQSLVHSIRPLLGLLAWGVIALLFFWLPPLATAIWGYAGIRFLMFELIDTPASRRNWSFADRKSRLDESRWFYVGFSGVAALMLLVPIVNLTVIPAAVAGLSLHFSRQEP